MHTPTTQTTRRSTRPRQHGLARRPRPFAIVLVTVGMLTAACSHGSSGPGVAGAGSSALATTSSSSGTHGNALAYSQCMRAHGLPDFPDPKISGTIDVKSLFLQGSHPDLDPTGSAFQTAQRACQSLQPANSAAQQQQDATQALRWAKCIRAQGITNFPDPDNNGEIHVAAVRALGIDVTSPRFHAAAAACRQYQPGDITVPGGS